MRSHRVSIWFMRLKSSAFSASDKLFPSLAHSAPLFPFLENSFEMKRQMALFKENVIKRNELLCQKLASAERTQVTLRALLSFSFVCSFHIRFTICSVVFSFRVAVGQIKNKLSSFCFVIAHSHTQTTSQMCSIFLVSQVECKFYATESRTEIACFV